MRNEIPNSTTIPDQDNMKLLKQNENQSQWERNSKSAHQKIYLDPEITISRVKSRKDHNTLFMESEMINTTTILDLDNTKHHNSNQEESKWEKS